MRLPPDGDGVKGEESGHDTVASKVASSRLTELPKILQFALCHQKIPPPPHPRDRRRLSAGPREFQRPLVRLNLLGNMTRDTHLGVRLARFAFLGRVGVLSPPKPPAVVMMTMIIINDNRRRAWPLLSLSLSCSLALSFSLSLSLSDYLI